MNYLVHLGFALVRLSFESPPLTPNPARESIDSLRNVPHGTVRLKVLFSSLRIGKSNTARTWVESLSSWWGQTAMMLW
jgi:hypothetical protein